MELLYDITVGALQTGIAVASLGGGKVARMVHGRRDTMHRCRPGGDLTELKGCVWVHAASLGEFEQGRPLIERLRREHPDKKILLTFFSPSGYEVRKGFDKVDAVAYLPGDTHRAMRRFIDAIEPSMAIFVKYEFWNNCLTELHKHHVPTYLISAIFRPSQPFFKSWGGVFKRMLRLFTHLFVQDSASVKLLNSIGITNVTVAGDTRFDRVTDIMKTTVDMPLIEAFTKGHFTLIAGSSWEPDENLYIPYLLTHPQMRAIIAPHEFDSARLDALLERCKGTAQLYSRIEAGEPVADTTRILIIDSFGRLASIYRYGTAAWVGGGFGAGIHNINEAAVYGLPVIIGPRHEKFKEARDLIRLGGAFCVRTKEEAAHVLKRFITDPDALEKASETARDYIRRSIGATDRIWAAILADAMV